MSRPTASLNMAGKLTRKRKNARVAKGWSLHMEVGSQPSGHIGFWRNSLHPVAVPSNLVARLSAETPNLEANDVPHPLSGGLVAQKGRLGAKIS